MTSHREPVEPAQFDLAQPQAENAPGVAPTTSSGDGRWVLPALGLLIALALLVIFWLPGAINSSDSAGPVEEIASVVPPKAISTQQAPRAVAATAPAASPAADQEDRSPWQDAQQARMRLEAQDVLGELLDLQFALEEQGVEAWAPGEFADASAQAEEGDKLYREQNYAQATERYAAARDALQVLTDGMPERLAAKLTETRSAIASGDIIAAKAALAAALAMAPDHDDIPLLQERIITLPQVLENLAQAQKSESQDDLDRAEELLQENTALDPLHKGSAQALDRIRIAIRERDFQTAMSRGYSFLETGDFGDAETAFRAALAIYPDSAEAKSALLEVDTSATTSQLAALQRKGSALEREERWSEAQAVYATALDLDASVLFANEGSERASERARLDKEFRNILEEPDRLAEKSVAAEASDFLRHARSITPAGRVLLGQIAELEALLQLANTPLAVTLQSDLETEVIVYKVARLGRFERQELDLRPGKYTAVGTRLGYRDVRREFTVQHGTELAPITVICSEPI